LRPPSSLSDQCEGDLKCWQRISGEVALGCIGRAEDGSRGDYCYDPMGNGSSVSPTVVLPAQGPPAISPTSSLSIPINHRGNDFCTSTNKCSLCEGDCDNDGTCFIPLFSPFFLPE
jgi:hypothetical protein